MSSADCVLCNVAEVAGAVTGPGAGLIAASRAGVILLGRVLAGHRPADMGLCRDHRAQVSTAKGAIARAPFGDRGEQLPLDATPPAPVAAVGPVADYFLLSMERTSDAKTCAWWRKPEGKGYTSLIAKAGRFSRDEAIAKMDPPYHVAIPCAAVEVPSSVAKILIREVGLPASDKDRRKLSTSVPAHIARLLRTFEPGARVVAAMEIVYAAHAASVPKGAVGTVQAVPDGIRKTTGAELVLWDDIDTAGGALHGLTAMTSVDAIDPAPAVPS